MPHRAGHSPVPEFGIGEIGPVGTGGYNPNAVMDRLARLEASNQLYFPDGRPRFPLSVMEPYRQGIGRENLARGAAGFVPGVGTAVNWNQMGRGERTFSLGLDALDLLTGGGGKPATAALRGLMKLAKYNPFDPKMVSVRGGLPRMDEAGNWLPSINAITGQPEAGVSVYQGAQFPFGRGTVLRNAPYRNIEYDDPTGTIKQNYPSWAQGRTYFVNPLADQEAVIRGLPEDMYRITGDVMPGVKGSGWEALVNPETISGVKNIPFSQLQRLAPFPSYPAGMHKTGLGFGTGLPITSERMGHKALDLFAKHDPQGTPFPINPNAIEQWLAQARLASTIPATVPARGVNYTWDTPGLFGGASPTNRGNLSPGG